MRSTRTVRSPFNVGVGVREQRVETRFDAPDRLALTRMHIPRSRTLDCGRDLDRGDRRHGQFHVDRRAVAPRDP